MSLASAMSLDFETRSTCDLKKVGAARYAADPGTHVLCLAWQRPGDAEPSVWRPGEAFPAAVSDWVAAGGPVAAWNIPFDRSVWNFTLRRLLPSLPRLTIEQTWCSMAIAQIAGLPGSLAACAAYLRPEDAAAQKDADGKKLMMRLSKPRGWRADGSPRWWHEEEPDLLDRLSEYCRQDVAAERAIIPLLPEMPAREREVWLLDQRINERGVHVDGDLVSALRAITADARAELDECMREATRGAVASCSAVAQLGQYLASRGIPPASLDNDHLERLLDTDPRSMPASARLALELRHQANKASTAKLNRLWDSRLADGRIRGMFRYAGANTGRWTSSGVQLQNFPRGLTPDDETLIEDLKGRYRNMAVAEKGDPFDVVAAALRGCIAAPEGKHFASADFSQIEARVIAWLAGDQALLDVFRRGDDVYRITAARMFGVAPDDVTRDQRQQGKVAVLALGYAGGVGALQSMARGYGLDLSDDQAERIKVLYRQANGAIVRLWRSVEDMARQTMANPGRVYRLRHVPGIMAQFCSRRATLGFALPSGRVKFHRNLRVEGRELVHDDFTRGSARQKTYGGRLVQGLTQAIARDVLADRMLAVDALPGVDVVGSVHDEVLMELDDAGMFETVRATLATPPEWAADLPVDADGYVGRRYAKA